MTMVYKFRGTVVVGLMVLFLWMGSTDAARPEPTTCTTTHLGQDRLSTQQQQQQQHCRITMAKLRAGSNAASLITDTDTDSDEEENYYKSRDDWWKDPLAMFDESDDQVETQVVDHRKGNPASSSSSSNDQQQQQQDSQQLDSVMEANITTKSSQQSNSMQQQQHHDDDDYFLLQQEEEEEEEEHVDFAIVEKNRDTNHQTKPKQQQRRRRRPTPKVAGPVRQTKQNVSSSSSSGVTTLPAPLAKSLTDFQALVDDKPVVQILTAVAMTKYVGGLIRNHVKKKNPKEDEMDGRSDDEMVYDDDDDDEVMEEEEEHARYAYTRASRTIYDDDDDEEEEDATQADDEANEEPTGRKRRGLSVPQWVQSVGKRIPLPGGGRRVILQELEELKEKQKAYERERADLSADCEQARHKLSEAQSELAALSTTTRYLKAQLRDNEQSLDQAVVAEQTKAKMELTKMKDAMLRVLEKERRAMREELRRRTNELQAMMEASNQEGDEIEM